MNQRTRRIFQSVVTSGIRESKGQGQGKRWWEKKK